MRPLPHRYHVRLVGGKAPYGCLAAAGLTPLETAAPVEFGGPGDAWSPEQLLLAAVQSCFLFTFGAVARASKVDFDRLDIEAAGIVDNDGGVTRFVDIVLTVKLTVPAGSDHQQLLRLIAKTEKHCLVSSSLSTRVHVEPEIYSGSAASIVTNEPSDDCRLRA
jgi:peroxiredoxin-like protein